VIGAVGDNAVVLYLGDGTGSFTTITVSTDVKQVTDIDVGDVDGDGDLDIVSISGSDDAVYWHENNGDGNLRKFICFVSVRCNCVISNKQTTNLYFDGLQLTCISLCFIFSRNELDTAYHCGRFPKRDFHSCGYC